MSWNSWQDFFAMGGYGLYVWGSVIAVFTALTAEVTSLVVRWKASVAIAQRSRPVASSRHENQA